LKFEIITKASGGIVPGGLTKDGIIKGWNESEAALKVHHVVLICNIGPNSTNKAI
jgi:hypothetical protein